jgi:hypothetical protein
VRRDDLRLVRDITRHMSWPIETVRFTTKFALVNFPQIVLPLECLTMRVHLMNCAFRGAGEGAMAGSGPKKLPNLRQDASLAGAYADLLAMNDAVVSKRSVRCPPFLVSAPAALRPTEIYRSSTSLGGVKRTAHKFCLWSEQRNGAAAGDRDAPHRPVTHQRRAPKSIFAFKARH